jgi:hypothetical protein
MHETQVREATSIASQYNRFKRKEGQGILSFEQISLAENRIITHLLDLVNFPDDQPYPASKSIEEKKAPRSILFKLLIGLALVIGIVAGLIGIREAIQGNSNQGDDLQLTVFVTDADGRVVLENTGRIDISLGNRSLNATVGENGRTVFSDISAKYQGDSITIGLQAKGWEVAENKHTFLFDGEPIRMLVKKTGSLGLVHGTVKSRDGRESIAGAKVQINGDTAIWTDSKGVFNILLPEKMRVKAARDHYRLSIGKSGHVPVSRYYLPDTHAEFRLEKDRP